MALVTQSEIFPQLEEHLKKRGCFMVAGSDAPNFMTIGWATAGIIWGKPIMMVAVRLSRYTHDKMDALKEFTVCIPKDGTMAKELAFAGVKSGRDYDKAKELGLTYLPADKVSVPLLSDCAAAYECKVVYETEMHEAHLDAELRERYYKTGDYHTLYFGEILACHKFD